MATKIRSTTPSHLFPEDDRRRIEHAIIEAEKRTGAEFVLAVASRSAPWHRAADLFGVATALLVIALMAVVARPEPQAGAWAAARRIDLHPAWIMLAVAGGFFIGAAIADRSPWLIRLFTTASQRDAAARTAGAAAFQRLRIRRTARACGVLIYASLLEREAVVLGDDAVSEKLSEEEWASVCDEVTRGFADGRPAEGLTAALRRASDLLADRLPPSDADVDELTNTLHLLD